ncbi:hypothetical protein [Streptomyces flaveolus]|uniref:hypothetical protein n=1 Tax=Streptomyces flaveolus TaxID=67297 RepID=UPI00167042E6|nr:hypothetical protein [Streptomyces flaveolus]GGQ59202.1 hypothetical protein GCM10010216_21500 [Streptomyces flaveolus]
MAAAADSCTTVVKQGVFVSGPFTVRSPITDHLDFVTLAPLSPSAPAGELSETIGPRRLRRTQEGAGRTDREPPVTV